MDELEQYKQNLRLLKEQAARYGMDIPLALQNNISFHERRIEELQATQRPTLSRWAIIKAIKKDYPRQFEILLYVFIGGLLIIYGQYFGAKDSVIGYLLTGSKWIWDGCVGMAAIFIALKLLYLFFVVLFRNEK